MKKRGEELEPIGAIMRRAGMAPPSPHKLRLIDAAVQIAAGEDDRQIAYHHTVFCQTALPYRHREERIWERSNGFLSLSVEAGRALHPETREWVNLPLPFGPKARLIMIHLDTEAKLKARVLMIAPASDVRRGVEVVVFMWSPWMGSMSR